MVQTHTGIASFYHKPGRQTSSGEMYSSRQFNAAIQIDLRKEFGGAYASRSCGYALVEANGKKAIVRINDVGPLKRGRVIDFSLATKNYFGGGGLVRNVKATPLPGYKYKAGPVSADTTYASLTGGKQIAGVVPHDVPKPKPATQTASHQPGVPARIAKKGHQATVASRQSHRRTQTAHTRHSRRYASRLARQRRLAREKHHGRYADVGKRYFKHRRFSDVHLQGHSAHRPQHHYAAHSRPMAPHPV